MTSKTPAADLVAVFAGPSRTHGALGGTSMTIDRSVQGAGPPRSALESGSSEAPPRKAPACCELRSRGEGLRHHFSDSPLHLGLHPRRAHGHRLGRLWPGVARYVGGCQPSFGVHRTARGGPTAASRGRLWQGRGAQGASSPHVAGSSECTRARARGGRSTGQAATRSGVHPTTAAGRRAARSSADGGHGLESERSHVRALFRGRQQACSLRRAQRPPTHDADGNATTDGTIRRRHRRVARRDRATCRGRVHRGAAARAVWQLLVDV